MTNDWTQNGAGTGKPSDPASPTGNFGGAGTGSTTTGTGPATTGTFGGTSATGTPAGSGNSMGYAGAGGAIGNNPAGGAPEQAGGANTGNQAGDKANASSGTGQTGDLKAKMSDDLHSTQNTIKKTSDAAIEKVSGVVTDQKNFAAQQLGGIAAALSKVGDELQGSDQAGVGRYAKQLGGSVQNFAKQVEGRDLGEIASMAEDFGRKQPLAFLGIAAFAGLAASRFLTASTKSTSTSTSSTSAARPTSATPQTTAVAQPRPTVAIGQPRTTLPSGGNLNG